MVVVDGVTFACQRCITGHRATKCQHHDRELSEIKKKGRPIGCLNCSELRRTKAIHAKCSCSNSESNEVKVAKKRKTLKDVLDVVTHPAFNSSTSFNSPTASTSQLPYSSNPSSSLEMKGLLNSCQCGKGGSCTDCIVTSFLKARPSSTQSAFSSTSQPCCPKPPPAISLPQSYQFLQLDTSLLPPTNRSNSVSNNVTRITKSQLFIPSTHGTSSCFCGEACSCVGCPQHDPLGRKASSSRRNSSISSFSSCGTLGSIEEVPVGVDSCNCSSGGTGRISTNDILVGPPPPSSLFLPETSGIEVLITAAATSTSNFDPSFFLPTGKNLTSSTSRTDLPSFEQLLKLVNQEDLLQQSNINNNNPNSLLSLPLPSLLSINQLPSLPSTLSPILPLPSLPLNITSTQLSTDSSKTLQNLEFENPLLATPVCSILDPELEFEGGCIGQVCTCVGGGCGCQT